MPLLLDAQPTIAPAIVAAVPRPVADRFPAGFYDMARPVGNAAREPWAVGGARARTIRGFIRLANAAARASRLGWRST